MDTLPPIPTPVSQRWREFRIRVLPLLFFVVIAFAATALWKEVAIPPMTGVGYVETNSAIVSAPLPGFVAQMSIKRFESVKAGEPICQLVLQDPKVVEAEVNVIRAEIDMIRVGMEPLIARERASLSYYSLRLDMMKARGDQATQNILLRQAMDDFKRQEELFKDKIIPENVFQQAQTKVDTLQTSIIERSNLLETLQANLKNFDLPDITQQSNSPIQAAIAVEEAKLRRLEAMQGTRPLLAPIDGMVSFVYRRTGESVVAGEPLLMISAVQSDQVVAYVRQPLVFQPKIGMDVQVRSRNPRRETGKASVRQVGAQMESYNTAMLPIPSTRPVEWGLPVLLSLPQGLKLVPGELVDIVFEPK
jgi:multidrug resistance efflux pump